MLRQVGPRQARPGGAWLRPTPTRRAVLASGPLTLLAAQPAIGERTVVLTFDDSVKSHLTLVAPLLKELAFGATFFVTHRWMEDRERFLDWDEIAQLNELGFEIGNHTWSHRNLSLPRNASRLAGQLALVENALDKAGVPRPVSFAWPGNAFGPEVLATLQAAGYRFARRGAMPEAGSGEEGDGALFNPRRHHPLLIPTTGNARPDWTLERFQAIVSRARAGHAVVLQFHGVPDEAHPWVHTPPELFRSYMRHLKDGGYRVIALRDLAPHIDLEHPADDPLRAHRHPPPKKPLPPPVEIAATRADLPYWLSNMLHHHAYSPAEAAAVSGTPLSEIRPNELPRIPRTSVLPYPGGRHPRIGFLEGAIDPLRGAKASIFLPWDSSAYVVVDLPEAIFSNLGLLFLAHTHVPSIWDAKNVEIDNTDWQRQPGGGLRSTWRL
ncbi:MAG: polysaccharide deacetylase family protein, partial [bacterium]|nr:polysaccharide deacetylase family protein [bacterium]